MTAADQTVTADQKSGNTIGFVLAGDRAAERRLARRHTRLVSILKVALPVSALATVGVFFASVMTTAGWNAMLPELAMPKIIPSEIAMQNPSYEGFNADGGRYSVRAKSARPDLKALHIVRLNEISGEMIDADKKVTTLAAASGVFNSRTNVLNLSGKIQVRGEDGLSVNAEKATINTKEGLITSQAPVTVAVEAGNIRAKSMTLRQKAKEYTFSGDVLTTLSPKPPSKPADAVPQPQPAGLFGSTTSPIEIGSNRLDINDNTKTAVFSGGVKAIQDKATLTTSDLEVFYEGAAVQRPGDSRPDAAAEGRLKSISVRHRLMITQDTGETIAADSADFDAIANVAKLTGAVTVTQLPDKAAVAETAELNQLSNVITLSGNVVVTQGKNELRGERLVFDRASSRMAMTATGNGRVRANFVQNAGASGNVARASAPLAERGIPFGANFRSEPGAPVKIEAARLDVDDNVRQAVFKGDVRASQGNFVLRATQVAARYTGSASLAGTSATAPAAPDGRTPPQAAAQLTKIEARDKVEIVSSDGQTASGDWADFDTTANRATLGGNVILKQGKNVVRGTRLEIDMTTGQSTLKSDPAAASGGWASTIDGAKTKTGSDGRPSAVFFPGELRNKGGDNAQPASGGWSARTAP